MSEKIYRAGILTAAKGGFKFWNPNDPGLRSHSLDRVIYRQVVMLAEYGTVFNTTEPDDLPIVPMELLADAMNLTDDVEKVLKNLPEDSGYILEE